MAQKDSQRLSKQERREAARAEAARLREEQERRDKRNKMLFLGGGLVLLALVVVAAVMIVMNGNKSALDGVDRPEGSDLQGGIPVSSELVAGKDDGTVRVDLYSDYTCTHCNNLENINGEDLEALMSEGTATIWFHPVATMDGSGNFSGYSGLATNAIATVAHHAPETFLEANFVHAGHSDLELPLHVTALGDVAKAFYRHTGFRLVRRTPAYQQHHNRHDQQCQTAYDPIQISNTFFHFNFPS